MFLFDFSFMVIFTFVSRSAIEFVLSSIYIRFEERLSPPDNPLECLSRNTIHSFFPPYFFYLNAFNNIYVLIFGFVFGRIISNSHICGFIGIEIDCIRTDYYKRIIRRTLNLNYMFPNAKTSKVPAEK